jgi:hypothetical protein
VDHRITSDQVRDRYNQQATRKETKVLVFRTKLQEMVRRNKELMQMVLQTDQRLQVDQGQEAISCKETVHSRVLLKINNHQANSKRKC